MHNEKDSFDEFMYRGLDSLLKMTARAGDSIRVASNRAIDKIDYARLEKKLVRLYADLGRLAYANLSLGLDLECSDEKSSDLINEIDSVAAELARRQSCEPYENKNEKKDEKNHEAY